MRHEILFLWPCYTGLHMNIYSKHRFIIDIINYSYTIRKIICKRSLTDQYPLREYINWNLKKKEFLVNIFQMGRGLILDHTSCLDHHQPLYLAQILPRYTSSRSLRSSFSITISALLRRTSIANSKPFSSTASCVWNKLPTHVSSALTLPVFRKYLKHHFFPDAYPGFITIESIMPST